MRTVTTDQPEDLETPLAGIDAAEPVEEAFDDRPPERQSLLPVAWDEVMAVVGSVKTICDVNVYGNIAILLLGLLEFCRFRLSYWFLLPIAMCALQVGVLVTYRLTDENVVRVVQFVLMIYFGQYVARAKLFDRVPAYWFAFVLIGILLALEVKFVGPQNVREVGFASFLPRYSGPRGDANFTALACCGLGVLAATRRFWLTSLAMMVLSMPSMSRGALVGVMAAIGISFVMRIRSGITRWIVVAMLLAPFAYPVLPWYCDNYLSRSEFDRLNETSSNRLLFQVGYFHMGLERPIFGHGFFQSQGDIIENLPYKVEWESEPLEQHSLYLQVWSDFGLVAFGLFAVFFWYLATTATRTRPSAVPCLAYIAYSMLFLNGLTDWTVWLLIGESLRGLYDGSHDDEEKDYYEDEETLYDEGPQSSSPALE
jgi:hypothetical protein